MKYFKCMVILAVVLLAAGCNGQATQNNQPIEKPQQNQSPAEQEPLQNPIQELSFDAYNKTFAFSGVIPQGWKAEYVAGSDSINIYNPAAAGGLALEQSQIFIRHFRASSFLTLPTITIHSREEAVVNGNTAVRYEIEKKANVANFPAQPSWRSKRHKLIDIRSSANNPTEFFVFAYNPNLPESIFNEFINSIRFY